MGTLIAVVVSKRRKAARATELIENEYQKPELDGRGVSADVREISETEGRQKDVPLELEAHQTSELAGSAPRYEIGEGGTNRK